MLKTIIISFPLATLLVSSADNFANSLDPDQAQQMLGMVWIQTVRRSDGIPEIFLKKKKDF